MNKFNIFTAVDILGGKCVRLNQGRYDRVTTYEHNPIVAAQSWKHKGADFLHLVDLDGARSGNRDNINIIRDIINETGLKVQVGGGIRSLAAIRTYLGTGVERVILGSIAVHDPDLVNTAMQEFGAEKFVISLDCLKGFITTDGWEKGTKLKAIDIIEQFPDLKTVVYTDIEKDGMLEGPNLRELKEFALNARHLDIIASGGISGIHDVIAVKELQNELQNINGVIIGKALYDNRINPEELYSQEIYN